MGDFDRFHDGAEEPSGGSHDAMPPSDDSDQSDAGPVFHFHQYHHHHHHDHSDSEAPLPMTFFAPHFGAIQQLLQSVFRALAF
jgi:hypothetical protein